MKSLKSKVNTVFPGHREVLTSMVKQELLEKMDTDLATWQKIIFCSPESQVTAARKYDSCRPCITCLFHTDFFFDVTPLSTIISVSEYLARARRNVLHLRDKAAKSIGEMKDAAADCCAHSTSSAWLVSVSLIVMTQHEFKMWPLDQTHFHTALLEGKEN